MKAVVLNTYHTDLLRAVKSLQIAEVAKPTPADNQVLVNVHSTPCNPADLSFIRGVYGIKKEPPVTPGFEGLGKVVGTGNSPEAKALAGKRVAFAANDSSDGTWAEYAIADAGACFPLSDNIPNDQGATIIVNPFTAYALVEKAQNYGSRAMVITAAASQLGGMVRAIAKQKGIVTINIVREDDQIQHLQQEDADYALNMRDEDFFQKLQDVVNKEQATTAIESVSGGVTGIITHALPPDSQVIVYGSLSEDPISNVDPRDLIFHNKNITGFALGRWFKEQSLQDIGEKFNFIQDMMMKNEIKTTVQNIVNLDNIHSALHSYIGNMSAGKIIFTP